MSYNDLAFHVAETKAKAHILKNARRRKRRELFMLDQAYDAAVIGARVAGATVAALLGDAGYRVLLIDRASFPSATLSTHFFRGAGLLAVLSPQDP